MRFAAENRSAAGMLALLAALALASGCGDDTVAEGSPADGEPVAGTDYELNLAPGWTSAEPQAGEEIRLQESDQAVVTVSRIPNPPPELDLAELTAAAQDQLQSAELPTEATPESEAISLAGVEALGYEAKVTVDGRSGSVRGLVALRDGVEYAIVLATPTEVFEAQLADLEGMLGSWSWSDSPGDAVSELEAPPPSADTVPPPSSSGTVPPPSAATGEETPATGTGYELLLPKGWSELPVSEPPPGLEPPPGYVPPERQFQGETIDGVAVTVSVSVDAGAGDVTAQSYAEQNGYFGDQNPSETALGGAPALTAVTEFDGPQGVSLGEQVVVAVDGRRAYVVRFTAPADRFDELRAAFDAITASWTWS